LKVANKEHKPKNRHKDGDIDAREQNQDVETQDIEDYRAEDRQSQWHVTIEQQERTADDLHRRDNESIVRLSQDGDELAGEAAGQFLYGDELQEAVQAEDHEDQA